jgi:hypothetical protein
VSGEWWTEEQVVASIEPGERRRLVCAQVEVGYRHTLGDPRIIATFLDDEPRSVDELYRRRVYRYLYKFGRPPSFAVDVSIRRCRDMLEALGADVRDPDAVRTACERGYLAGRAVLACGGQITRPRQRFVEVKFEPAESTDHEVALRKLVLIAPCWPSQARRIPPPAWWLSLPREIAEAWEPVAQARALAMKSDEAAARWMRVAGLLEVASRNREPAAHQERDRAFTDLVSAVAAARGVAR